jgi:hypothetical protein
MNTGEQLERAAKIELARVKKEGHRPIRADGLPKCESPAGINGRGLLPGTSLHPNTKQRAGDVKVTTFYRCVEDSGARGNPGNGQLVDAAQNAYVPVP